MHFDCAGSRKRAADFLVHGIFPEFSSKLTGPWELSICISTAQARAKRGPPSWDAAFFL